MKKTLIAAGLGAVILTAGCASTFVASKDGKGYHLGNSSNAAYEMFCKSGDLKKILAETSFDQNLRDNLYESNCGVDKSSKKVKEIFASMTPAQRKELRQSFKKNGYEINIMRC
jgi:hypothetical protein